MNWYDVGAYGLMAIGAIDVLLMVLGWIFPKVRWYTIAARARSMRPLYRQALVFKLLAHERCVLGRGGVDIVVMADDQAGSVFGVPDYERAAHVVEWMWMQHSSGQGAQPLRQLGPWRAEYFDSYTGPQGDFMHGHKVDS